MGCNEKNYSFHPDTIQSLLFLPIAYNHFLLGLNWKDQNHLFLVRDFWPHTFRLSHKRWLVPNLSETPEVVPTG